MKQISEDEQNTITHVCVHAALLLMQHGAESSLVEAVPRRLGIALGVDSVEVAVMSNAITLTTLCGKRSQTTVRRNMDKGINMYIATEVQRIMLDTEKGRWNVTEVEQHLEDLRPFHYNRWLVAVLVGFSCAAFAWLAHADFAGCIVTFVASFTAMVVRQTLASKHVSPVINFTISAFVATSIAAQSLLHNLGTQTPEIVMASSVLLFVPGMPLINGLSDMVKGYINTGLARLGIAILLGMGTCIGILFAMLLWKAHAWL